jgi:hypothetical protein
MTMFFGVFEYGYIDIPSVNLASSTHIQPVRSKSLKGMG